MSDSSLLQSPRNRFMAFSAVGVAMVCLPLWQVLQYQQADMTQLAAERALLDPVSRAVHVQFGLLAHRQVAAQLLQGQPQLEPARQAVQVGVDDHLLSLSQDLTKGLWSNALAETRDLTRDWQALARQVKARTLTAPQSEEAHVLRIEQAVQVVDLVTLAEIVSSTGGGTARLAGAARVLTHMATEMPLPTLAAQPAVELSVAQTRLQARLTTLERTLAETPAAIAREPAAAPFSAAGSLRPALAEVASATRQLLLLLPGTVAGVGADTPELSTQRERAWQSARTAQLNLFNQALRQHKRALALRRDTLQRQQIALLAAMALLSAAALALAAVLARQLGGTPDADGALLAEIDRLEEFAKGMGTCRIDLSKVKTILAEEAELFSIVFQRLRRSKIPLWFNALDDFAAILKAAINEVGVTGQSSSLGWWSLLFELTIVDGRMSEYEELGLEYAVAFEMSPPAWEVVVRPSTTGDGAPVTDKGAALSMHAGFPLNGVIGQGSKEMLQALSVFAASKQEVLVDMSGLLRIDFAVAGQFFESIRAIQLAQKRVILSNLNELVAALLEVFGMSKHAILMRKKSV